MSFFTWTDRLDIGVSSMNDEHKVLLDLMNQLHAANEREAPHAELRRLLDRLVQFTRKHFADEEAYLEAIVYPDLKIHKTIHRTLLEQLATHQQSFAAKPGPVPQDLFDFLKMWLNAHIQGIDMKYGVFAKGQRKAG